ncbi:MAG: hypothetical protein AAFY36_11575, partial [Bacteroidota bacterium]
MRFAILLFLLLAVSSSIFSQENSVSPTLPPAPGAAAISRYEDVPVGEFTGSLNFMVPIYNISYKEINSPISLSYNSIGAKVAEEASEVGLGWSINSGGIISRTIRGKDDFGGSWYDTNPADDVNYYKVVALGQGYGGQGYRFGSPTQDGCWEVYDDANLFVEPLQVWCTNASDPSNPCNHVPNNCQNTGDSIIKDNLCQFYRYLDLESDLYTFSIGGLTGKFVIGQNGEIKTLEQSELKIEVNYTNSRDVSWRLTAPNGIVYILGNSTESRQLTYTSTITESTSSSSSLIGYDPLNFERYISTWYLDSIITPRGEVVTFDYTYEEANVVPVPQYSETASDVISIDNVASSCGGNQIIQWQNTGETKVATLITYDDIKLSSIQTPFGK